MTEITSGLCTASAGRYRLERLLGEGGMARLRLSGGFLGASFLLMSGAPLAAQSAPSRAFTGATLIDGTGAAAVPNAVVVVREARITCAGSRAACPIPVGTETVDVSGRWILPGLVDAHVHYSQTGWADGRPDALDMRERFPYDRTIAGLKDPRPFYRSYLCSGVTATYDVGGFPWTWGLRRAADTDVTAPHVAAAGPLLSTRDHWLNLPGERQFLYIPSDSAVITGARYLIENRTDAIKVWFLISAGTPDTASWAARLRLAGEEARRGGVPLIVHASTLWAATQAVNAGAHLLVHGVTDQPVDQAFILGAQRAETIYTPTLVVRDGYAQLRARKFRAEAYDMACVDPATRAKAFLSDSIAGGLDESAIARAAEQAAVSFQVEAENVLRVHRAGIPVAMGTDAGNPLTLHGPSVFLEMEALERSGLTPMDVIVASTRNGALAMGRLRDFGTVEPGKIADLVVVDADPLQGVRNLRRVSLVVRGGQVHRRTDLEFR